MIKTKPWTGGTDEEYETQHFGFGVQRLQIDVRQMVKRTITTAVKDMESFLHGTFTSDTDKSAITHSCNKLIQMYCERAEPALEVVDKEIANILNVPSNVVLPEDEVQLEQVTDEEYVKLQEEVADLRKRVERAALMENLLKVEMEQMASIEKVFEAAKKNMELIDLLEKYIDVRAELSKLSNETKLLCAEVTLKKPTDDTCQSLDLSLLNLQ